MTATNQQMGRLRSLLFPVYPHEFKKFLPMAFIMLCVLFNYTVLRNTKDALIATGAGAGIEAIPYLKSIFVMSGAILFVVIYTKLANLFSSEKVFYLLGSFFLLFFGCFTFFMYPHVDVLHPSLETVQSLQLEFPRLKFLISVWGVWTYSLFYVFAELWGSVMVSLLFWQFANEIVRSKEAGRFYPLFVLVGNIGLIFSGKAVEMLSDIRKQLPPEVDAWGISLQYLGTCIVLAGILMMATYYWMHRKVLTDKRFYDPSEKKQKKKKAKLSVVESFKYIGSNPYVGLIALLVLSYGASINLVEFIWKKQIATHFAGDPNGYNAFMGSFSMWTGISTITIIFLTKGIINRLGWFVGAIITPSVLLIGGISFLSFVLFREELNPLIMSTGFSATYAAVILGMIQNISTKGAKYALFDPTKEMSYIPLDQELKVKGKAAVDVVGARLGKASGGWLIMTLFFIVSAQDAMDVAPFLSFLVIGIVLLWFYAVVALSRRYNKLVKE